VAERLAAYINNQAETVAALRRAVTAYERDQLAAAQEKWEATIGAAPPAWQSLELNSLSSKHGAKFVRQADGSTLVSGTNKVSDVYALEAIVPTGKLTALRLEVLPDKSLPGNGPGRSNNGNFVLATLRVKAGPATGEGESVAVSLVTGRADFSQQGFSPELALNDKPSDGWAIAPQLGKRHVAAFESKQPFGFEDGTKLTIELDQRYARGEPHNIGSFRLSVSSSSPPVPLDGLPEKVMQALAVARDQRSAAQTEEITAYYRTIDPELTRLNKAVTDHQAKTPKLADDKKAQTVSEMSQRRATRILLRGDFLNPGDEVQPGTLAVLPTLTPRGKLADRLDLAGWLVDPANPLPARVAVNRVWQHLFGRGMVATSDDFGKQGDKPSHPELLDWLASRYADGGWNLKKTIRSIVLSAAYQQASAPRSDLNEVDPENVLLARQSRLRLEAEIIRDVSLAASGLIAGRIGGPSVRPPQPAEYANLTYANSVKWNDSTGADRYRRGMYTFFQRTSPYPMLMTFDSPDSNECAVRRQTSNTPLQALTLWNDPVFFEAAQSLARRVVREVSPADELGQTVRERCRHAFALCLSRRPSEPEVNDLVALHNVQLRLLLADEAAARQMIGPEPPPEGMSPAELAAWVGVGRTILNLDEFITRE
jgi:hypothetical protein